MSDPSLRADCTRCVGLCCVALSFERSQLFAFSKAAGHRCRHLTGIGRCQIHAGLETHGMAGCARYDCLGAGQMATAMFTSEGRVAARDEGVMLEAFHILARVQQLLQLLKTAARLPLPPLLEQRRARLELLLSPAGGWSPARVVEFAKGSTALDVWTFLRELPRTAGLSA